MGPGLVSGEGKSRVGDFSKSIKKTLAQVFGRGDLEEVLGEEWEFSAQIYARIYRSAGNIHVSNILRRSGKR